MASYEQPGQLLGAIFSASPDAVVVVDDLGKIVLSSPAVTALFGYYPEELVGEPVEILLPADCRDRHIEHMSRYFSAPIPRLMGAGLELVGQHRDGRRIAVDVSLAPVEVRGGRYAAAFVRDARERQRGVDRLSAVQEVTQRLLAGSDGREILPLIAQRARQLSRSDVAWIVAPAPSGELEITSVDGTGSEALLGAQLSAETSRSAEVMRSGSSAIVEDLATAENVPDAVVELNLGPGLYVPLIADERRLGTLVIGRVRGSPAFETVDVAFAEVFASAIAASIELGEVRAELGRLEIVTEDERIARDLHDTVIQQLFAIGMSLQAARARASTEVGERIDAAVTNLDSVIREIRNTIFRLPGRTESARGLREEMLRLADKYSDELGFTPRIAFHGPVDTSVPDVVTDHITAVLTESLSNAAKHAGATAAEGVVAIENGWLVFSFADNGVGIADGPSAGEGLRNMASRAQKLGGTFSVSNREPNGTIVDWRVPI